MVAARLVTASGRAEGDYRAAAAPCHVFPARPVSLASGGRRGIIRAMTPALALPLFAAVAAAVVLATGLVLPWLRRRQILDRPNDRSSHSLPTPRGGGLAVMAVLLPAWGLAAPDSLAGGAGPTVIALLCAAGLAAVSWLDDLRGLPPLPRFLAQGLAVAVVLALLPGEALVFQGVLPLALDRLLTALCWLWFINLYNFMDGIDGITGVETASIGGGVAVLAAAGLAAPVLLAPGVVVLAAALGFLVWNWHPAKLFMGDVGSVPLGFLLGLLLITLAVEGQLAAALILPLYHIADATLTLLRRLRRGEKPWEAHRSHFYQRAVRGGLGHGRVSGAVAVANLGLIGCAVVAAAGLPWLGLLAAVALVAALLTALSRRAVPMDG